MVAMAVMAAVLAARSEAVVSMEGVLILHLLPGY